MPSRPLLKKPRYTGMNTGRLPRCHPPDDDAETGDNRDDDGGDKIA